MRFLQGIAVGGEWGGAVLMAVEHAPEGKKGFFGSLPQAGVAPGLILSSLAMGAVAALPEEDMLSWGWRLPFLASVVLLLVGWFIRVKVAESPDFEQMREKGAKVEVPVAEVLKHHRRALLVVVGARLAEVTWFYTVVTFSLAYATGTLGIPRSVMLDATIWGAALALFTMPLFGVLGDKIGHKWVFMAGTVGILICAPVFFKLMGSGDKAWIIVAVCLAFPAHVRYTGISLAVQVSGAIGGGLAPIVATWLLAKGGGDPKYVVWYLSALGVVAFFSAWRMQGEAATPAALRVPAAART
ncbi:hypothetical protein G6F22_013363 [Rhizopus arrhizus]|nr:hypothetical protein G6F22_013363 [Rhizopus arrhizus]